MTIVAGAIATLCEDHRMIEKVLGALERFAREPLRVPVSTWARALDFVSKFADDLHHGKEEEVLFPELARRGLPSDAGPVACMLHDHTQGRDLRRAMSEALPMLGSDPGCEVALRESALEYVRLLRFHIQKEDQVLFPLAGTLVDDEGQRSLYRRFAEVVARHGGAAAVARFGAVADDLAAVAAGLGPVPVGKASLDVISRSCAHGRER